jgi:hypothetical protein
MDQPSKIANWIFILLGLLFAGVIGSSAIAAQGDDTATENGIDVLAYGPIHEAFGETVQFDPEPGITVPKAPPDAINEIPPEQKPEGDVEWIPGYWAWDDDRNDFIWVSGIWRVIPPDRQWVPGYWFKATQGYQWVSGYWARYEASNTEYLPEPPESVEVGPNVAPPSPDYQWIPGCWVWYTGRYAWRPGYWAPVRSNWIWVPAHYVWTPRGYIFVGGYWDFAVTNRGVIFAPVSFSFNFRLGSGFYFRPTYVIDLGIFSDLLFVNPRYRHYYFGDYYAPRYYRRGIYPWFSPHAMRRGYDPIYAHQRWKNRYDRGWEKRLEAKYQKRRINVQARPPRRLYETGSPVNKLNLSKIERQKTVMTPPTIKKIGRTPSKFQPLSQKERIKIEKRNREVITYTGKRQKLETQRPMKVPSISKRQVEPNRVKMPKSPISAKQTYSSKSKNVPPNRYQAPKLNPTVEPLKKNTQFQRPRATVNPPAKTGRDRITIEKPSRNLGQPTGERLPGPPSRDNMPGPPKW